MFRFIRTCILVIILTWRRPRMRPAWWIKGYSKPVDISTISFRIIPCSKQQHSYGINITRFEQEISYYTTAWFIRCILQRLTSRLKGHDNIPVHTSRLTSSPVFRIILWPCHEWQIGSFCSLSSCWCEIMAIIDLILDEPPIKREFSPSL